MRTGQVLGSLLIKDKFIFYLEREKEKTTISQCKSVRKMIFEYLKCMHIKNHVIPPYEKESVKGFYSRA